MALLLCQRVVGRTVKYTLQNPKHVVKLRGGSAVTSIRLRADYLNQTLVHTFGNWKNVGETCIGK